MASRTSVYSSLLLSGTMPSSSFSIVWLTNFSDFSVGTLETVATDMSRVSLRQGISPLSMPPHSAPGKLPLSAPSSRRAKSFALTLLAEFVVSTTAR